jgi:hypothetical protein
MRYQVDVQAGSLSIVTHREDLPLESLLTFASRLNPKRGFLFVSKVLGKHIPCRPGKMRAVYDRLAEALLPLPAPVVMIGMAETATGLGAGIADSFARRGGGEDLLYLHTTRHGLASPVLLRFEEAHSHAPGHTLYAPAGKRAALFGRARSLVLVDDEISTGRTLQHLAEGLIPLLPGLRQGVLVSIVNWLPPARRHDLARRLPYPLRLTCLLEGTFEYRPAPGFRPQLPPHPGSSGQPLPGTDGTGRIGLRFPSEQVPLPRGRLPAGPLVVVGTGEYTFAPFLAAERLEGAGYDVLFQSTTRSPIAEGDAIEYKLAFPDHHNEGIGNYLYNLSPRRQAVVAYEHWEMANQHPLPAMLNAPAWAPP